MITSPEALTHHRRRWTCSLPILFQFFFFSFPCLTHKFKPQPGLLIKQWPNKRYLRDFTLEISTIITCWRIRSLTCRKPIKAVTRIRWNYDIKGQRRTDGLWLLQSLGCLPRFSMLGCTSAPAPVNTLLFGGVVLLICVSPILVRWPPSLVNFPPPLLVSQCDMCGSYVTSCLHWGERRSPELAAALVVCLILPPPASGQQVKFLNSMWQHKLK